MDPLDRLAHDRLRRGTPTIIRLDLATGRCWSGTLRPGQALLSAQGRLWVTQSGQAEDYILRPGQRWHAPAYGRVVAQGL